VVAVSRFADFFDEPSQEDRPLFGIVNADNELTVTDRVATRTRWMTIDADDALEVRR